MGDVQKRDIKFGFDLLDNFQNTDLQRSINHRDGFIGDDQAWFEQKCARDHNTLALPSAQLMRIFSQDFVWTQPHDFECIFSNFLALSIAMGELEFADDRLEHNVHFVEGVISAVGVMKDRLYSPQ